MPRPLAALAFMLAALIAAGPAAAQSGTGAEPATLSVNGEGRVDVAPDIATIRVGVETQGETAAEALEANSAAAAEMIATLKDAGVEARDIQTGQLNVQPVHADMQRTRPGESPEITGYRVVNEVAVTVRDLDALGGLLDRVVGAGANRVNAIGFGRGRRATRRAGGRWPMPAAALRCWPRPRTCGSPGSSRSARAAAACGPCRRA